MGLRWTCKYFDELTVRELYDIVALRERVFIVEQQILYVDADGRDLQGYHLFAYDGDVLCACARLLPAGLRYAEVSIGRVVVAPEHRGTGLGYELMNRAIEQVYSIFGQAPIHLSAQSHLEKFYINTGFERTADDEYIEDGILHVHMAKEA